MRERSAWDEKREGEKKMPKGETGRSGRRRIGFCGAALKVGKCKVSCGMIPVTGVQ